MASVYRKAGASGKMSLYWQSKFSGPDGRAVSKTTKLTDRKAALALAREWEKAAAAARGGLRALLSAASPEWYGLILFGYQAGLRLSDAAHLTWNNVDLEPRLLTFQPQKTRRSRK